VEDAPPHLTHHKLYAQPLYSVIPKQEEEPSTYSTV